MQSPCDEVPCRAACAAPAARRRRVEVHRDVRPDGFRSHSTGHALADALEVVDGPRHFGGRRDREVVQHRVGRAAGGHHQRDRVLDRLARDDVARLADSRLIASTSTRADSAAESAFSGSGDAICELPSRLMPSASNDEDIVFAVYMPPHAPTEGHALRSMPS